ncbi:MAG: flagellar motor switch protein FliN [Myxococcaceae bacterium]|nr:flagellar motor switch protein FliN [Myxococcaceae bacterium]
MTRPLFSHCFEDTLNDTATTAENTATNRRFELLLDVPLEVVVQLGRSRMTIQELLTLGPGSVIELDKVAGEPLDIIINDRLVARGEAVVVNDKFGVRITDIVSRSERIARLR